MRLDSGSGPSEKIHVITAMNPYRQDRHRNPSSSQKLLRNISLVAWVALSVFMVNDYIGGLEITSSIFAVLVFAFFPTMHFWMIPRHEEVAKAALLLVLNACALIADLSTPFDDGSPFFFVPIGLITLLFYETNEKMKIAYGLGLPLIGFALTYVPGLNIAPPPESTTMSAEFAKLINFTGVYAVTIAEILVFINYIRALRIEAALHSKFSALGILSSGIAHEINNPLAVIQGRAELLSAKIAAGAPAAQLESDAAVIRRTVERIARIIRGLRLFTRDSSGDPFVPVPASLMIETAMDLCQEKFQRAGIRVDVQVHHTLVVLGLETQLVQVLVNLLNNARDAVENTPDPWIRIDVYEDRICVTDSGSGIPQQIVDQIMIPFFTTKSADKGTGLGLSICKGILENHGGELLLDQSSPNTRFVMKFQVNTPSTDSGPGPATP